MELVWLERDPFGNANATRWQTETTFCADLEDPPRAGTEAPSDVGIPNMWWRLSESKIVGRTDGAPLPPYCWITGLPRAAKVDEAKNATTVLRRRRDPSPASRKLLPACVGTGSGRGSKESVR